MTGDCHAGICGSRGVRFPPATRHEILTTHNQNCPGILVRPCVSVDQARTSAVRRRASRSAARRRSHGVCLAIIKTTRSLRLLEG